jgi:hypothetical protein
MNVRLSEDELSEGLALAFRGCLLAVGLDGCASRVAALS